MKKQLLLMMLLLGSVTLGFSQSEKFASEMKEALYIHDTTSSLDGEVQALKAFQKLVKKYPNEWLPGYWTAYLCTQIARLEARVDNFPKDLNAKQLMKDSKKYYDLAVKAKGEMNDIEKSDFLMLEGFIYGFYENLVAENEDERNEFKSIRQAKYREAISYNPRNPLMYVLQGISLSQRGEYQSVLAGIGLLDYAEQIFNKAENRALTTYWNKDFVKFWRARAEARLKGMLEDEADKG